MMQSKRSRFRGNLQANSSIRRNSLQVSMKIYVRSNRKRSPKQRLSIPTSNEDEDHTIALLVPQFTYHADRLFDLMRNAMIRIWSCYCVRFLASPKCLVYVWLLKYDSSGALRTNTQRRGRRRAVVNGEDCSRYSTRLRFVKASEIDSINRMRNLGSSLIETIPHQLNQSMEMEAANGTLTRYYFFSFVISPPQAYKYHFLLQQQNPSIACTK